MGAGGLPTTGVYCPTVTLVGHQVGQQKCPPLLVLSDLSDLSDLFKKNGARRSALAGSASPGGWIFRPDQVSITACGFVEAIGVAE